MASRAAQPLRPETGEADETVTADTTGRYGWCAALAGTSAANAPAQAEAGDAIRPLVLISKPQATDPAQYQAAQLCMQEWRKLGLKVTLQVLPATQQSSVVWLSRTKWDMTTWEMVGRPERSDPDELTYALFHSSLAENGYDFVGYKNPEYDKLAEAQRPKKIRPSARCWSSRRRC